MGDLEDKIELNTSRLEDIKNYLDGGVWNSIKRTFAFGSLPAKRQIELAKGKYAPWMSTLADATIGSLRSVGNLLIGGTVGSAREAITSLFNDGSFTYMDFLNNYVDYSSFTIETLPKTFFNLIGVIGLTYNMYRAPYSLITKKPLMAFGWEPYLKYGIDKCFKKGGYLSKKSDGKYDEF